MDRTLPLAKLPLPSCSMGPLPLNAAEAMAPWTNLKALQALGCQPLIQAAGFNLLLTTELRSAEEHFLWIHGPGHLRREKWRGRGRESVCVCAHVNEWGMQGIFNTMLSAQKFTSSVFPTKPKPINLRHVMWNHFSWLLSNMPLLDIWAVVNSFCAGFSDCRHTAFLNNLKQALGPVVSAGSSYRERDNIYGLCLGIPQARDHTMVAWPRKPLPFQSWFVSNCGMNPEWKDGWHCLLWIVNQTRVQLFASFKHHCGNFHQSTAGVSQGRGV